MNCYRASTFMERIHRHSMLSVPPTWFVKDDLFPISVSFSSLLFLPVELLFHLCIFLSFLLQSRSLHLSPKKHVVAALQRQLWEKKFSMEMNL
jgi:hypothetical protein